MTSLRGLLVRPRWRRFAPALLLAGSLALAGCGGGDGGSGDGGAAGAGQDGATPGAQASGLPPTFVGIVAPEVLPASDEEVEQALDAQAKAGIRLFRQPFRWEELEPERGAFDFSRHDRLVGTAAKYGTTVLPILFGVRPGEGAEAQPGAKITKSTTMPPRSAKRFAAFATSLVRRYGSGGTYWAEHPDLDPRPITAWQIWNEPNLPAYWGGEPDPAAYARLLKTTATAIRAAEPEAEILTGGLPDSKIGAPLLQYVRAMVRAGAAGSFDTLAVHPYAQSAPAVLQGAKQARDAAIDAGAPADTGVWITEIGWATSGPGSSFSVSEAKQASLVVDLLRLAADRAEDLELHGIVYYAWRDSPIPPDGQDFWGLYTGLVKRDNTVKPALDAFAKAANELDG